MATYTVKMIELFMYYNSYNGLKNFFVKEAITLQLLCFSKKRKKEKRKVYLKKFFSKMLKK